MPTKSAVQLAVLAVISMGRSMANLGSKFTFLTQECSKCAHSPKHMGLTPSSKACMESSGSWSKNTAGVEPMTAREALENSSRVEHSKCWLHHSPVWETKSLRPLLLSVCDNIKAHKIWSKVLRVLHKFRNFSPLIKPSYHFTWPILPGLFCPIGKGWSLFSR